MSVLITDASPARRSFRGVVRERVTFVTVGDPKTDESQTLSCDIHSIVDRFTRHGVLPQGRQNGQFADVSNLQGDPSELRNRANEILARAKDGLEVSRSAQAAAAAEEQSAVSKEVKRQRVRRQAGAQLDIEDNLRPPGSGNTPPGSQGR